jgi:hypothetical protein
MTEQTSSLGPLPTPQIQCDGALQASKSVEGRFEEKSPSSEISAQGGLRRPGSGSRSNTTRRGPVQRKSTTQIVSETVDLVQSESPQSFRERLNAIQMR